MDVISGDAELTGVNVAELTGVDTEFDAEPTGVQVDTCAYGKAYDTVPKEQGNEIQVYGLGQQDPTEALAGKPSAEPTDLRRSTQGCPEGLRRCIAIIQHEVHSS